LRQAKQPDEAALSSGKTTKLSVPRQMKPEDLLDFIELPLFSRRWEQLGLDDEGDLSGLQLVIIANPKAGKVVKGTQGLRKLRYAPGKWNTGKSGATRVLYVHFKEFGIVLLCLVYAKGELDEISPAVKTRLNTLIDEIEAELRRRGSLQ
jgi:hypothetical protein